MSFVQCTATEFQAKHRLPDAPACCRHSCLKSTSVRGQRVTGVFHVRFSFAVQFWFPGHDQFQLSVPPASSFAAPLGCGVEPSATCTSHLFKGGSCRTLAGSSLCRAELGSNPQMDVGQIGAALTLPLTWREHLTGPFPEPIPNGSPFASAFLAGCVTGSSVLPHELPAGSLSSQSGLFKGGSCRPLAGSLSCCSDPDHALPSCVALEGSAVEPTYSPEDGLALCHFYPPPLDLCDATAGSANRIVWSPLPAILFLLLTCPRAVPVGPLQGSLLLSSVLSMFSLTQL